MLLRAGDQSDGLSDSCLQVHLIGGVFALALFIPYIIYGLAVEVSAINIAGPFFCASGVLRSGALQIVTLAYESGELSMCLSIQIIVLLLTTLGAAMYQHVTLSGADYGVFGLLLIGVGVRALHTACQCRFVLLATFPLPACLRLTVWLPVHCLVLLQGGLVAGSLGIVPNETHSHDEDLIEGFDSMQSEETSYDANPFATTKVKRERQRGKGSGGGRDYRYPATVCIPRRWKIAAWSTLSAMISAAAIQVDRHGVTLLAPVLYGVASTAVMLMLTMVVSTWFRSYELADAWLEPRLNIGATGFMMVTSHVLFDVALSAADDMAHIPPAVGLFAVIVPLGVVVGLVLGDEPWGRAKLVSLVSADFYRSLLARSLACCSYELLTRMHCGCVCPIVCSSARSFVPLA